MWRCNIFLWALLFLPAEFTRVCVCVFVFCSSCKKKYLDIYILYIVVDSGFDVEPVELVE